MRSRRASAPAASSIPPRKPATRSDSTWKVAAGKASYHSVNVYSSLEGKVPLGSITEPAFAGSADRYFLDDPAAAKLMYAFKVSRNCGGEANCVQLGISDCPKVTIGPGTVLGLFVRMYLEPATKVGAAMPEILYDRVIKFSR